MLAAVALNDDVGMPDMVASLDVVHDYLPKISETVAVTGTFIEQVKEICDLSCKDKSLLKLFDEGIQKYLRERARRSEETHQLLVSKKSIKGKVSAAVSGYGNELECFNNHLYRFSRKYKKISPHVKMDRLFLPFQKAHLEGKKDSRKNTRSCSIPSRT